jgi:ELWxxDGT repeat protein
MLGNRYIFSGSTAATGIELFITDGTPGGTQLIRDISIGTHSSDPAEFALLNGYLYFTAGTDAYGRELWRTDGTSAGTTLVKDINPGIMASNLKRQYHLFSTGTYLLFSAQGNQEGIELWKSDGTDAGTLMLKAINPGESGSAPDFFCQLNNTITVFAATNASTGIEFYRTDGTESGTFFLKDINVGVGSAIFSDWFGSAYFLGFNAFNNKLYFSVTDGTNAAVLYGTDGSTVNTTAVKVLLGAIDVFALPMVLLPGSIQLNNKFYFPLTDGESRGEIWQSDGTPAGTAIFKSYPISLTGSMPILFVNFDQTAINAGSSLFQGNKFFFSASTDAAGNELYLSNGTEAGTAMVKDINPGAGNSMEMLSYMFTSGPLFFGANNGVAGNELWKTDGASEGTVMVKDIRSGAGDSDPFMMLINNNKIFFSANDGDDPTKTDLFVVDGNFNPLPLTMGAISVAWNQQDAVLTWQTLQEENTSHFTIQRSMDAVHFTDLATVRAAGRSLGKINYTYSDKNAAAFNQTLYYRVVCSSKDGSRDYSRIVNLNAANGKWQVSIAGNQPGGRKQLQVLNASDEIFVQLFDISGKQLWQTRQAAAAHAIISLPNLNPGSYYVVISMGNEKQQLKLIQ